MPSTSPGDLQSKIQDEHMKHLVAELDIKVDLVFVILWELGNEFYVLWQADQCTIRCFIISINCIHIFLIILITSFDSCNMPGMKVDYKF